MQVGGRVLFFFFFLSKGASQVKAKLTMGEQLWANLRGRFIPWTRYFSISQFHDR